MGYSSFKSAPKSLVTSESIGPGQIQAAHLDPGLYGELKNIGLHNHGGAKSRRIKLQDLEGAFGRGGFYMYSTTGNKRYRITINDSGTISATEG